METLTDIEILNIITDDKESHSLNQIQKAQLIAEKRGLDIYLYINDRKAYYRVVKKGKTIDDRAINKKRFVNFLIDTFIIVILYLIISIAIDFLGSLKIKINWSNYQKLWSILIIFCYYSIQEGIWNITIGKIITGTIVVSEKNEKPSIPEILLRTACRFIPLEALSFTFMKDGFHDIFSKTKVIEIKK